MDSLLKAWVEETVLPFEGVGLPRVAGRVLAWLLVAEPPEQTAKEMAQALGASKGALGPALRLLARLRLVERLRRPQERADRYAIRPGAWRRLLLQKACTPSLYRAQAEKGLALLEGQGGERLGEMRDLYAFWRRSPPGSWRAFRRRHEPFEAGLA
ncbi:hypothetical protein TCCBUS3UF1_12540 [Thermus sp. CCB_US3_UF1]|uniref:MarR family transcriptional regulator n=1 Tax=Thermus sp. CCB_US3_UF1 TaxID=1111069 RepID=UPI000238A3E9|nr:MarR family transcriptional regulator [Thermus sp. CCB_US3_UF1]AEV16297.1 hypothetical protein TCCBUS3UF1_12540 [Thermus sp. CCB_US3_UF1]